MRIGNRFGCAGELHHKQSLETVSILLCSLLRSLRPAGLLLVHLWLRDRCSLLNILRLDLFVPVFVPVVAIVVRLVEQSLPWSPLARTAVLRSVLVY